MIYNNKDNNNYYYKENFVKKIIIFFEFVVGLLWIFWIILSKLF